jgi:hypothetical protein
MKEKERKKKNTL